MCKFMHLMPGTLSILPPLSITRTYGENFSEVSKSKLSF